MMAALLLASAVLAGPAPGRDAPAPSAHAVSRADAAKMVDHARLKFTRDKDGNPVCTLKRSSGDEILDIALCRVATMCARENWGDMKAVRACVDTRKNRILGLAAKERFARTPMP